MSESVTLADRIEGILHERIKCDATGLSPHIASVFLRGIPEAAAEIAALASTARAGAGDWQPIETVPADEEVEVRAGGMTFHAKLVSNGSLDTNENVCDQWQATREGEHPPCWSDGACWTSNADEVASLPVEAWRPLSAVPTSPRSGAGDDLEQATADQIKAGLEVFQTRPLAPAEHGAVIRDLVGRARLQAASERTIYGGTAGELYEALADALVDFHCRGVLTPDPAQSPSTSEEASPDTMGANRDQ